jgi:hypothetical protein
MEPLPPHTKARLKALLAEGLTPEQAAIVLRSKGGNPNKLWLDQMLALSRELQEGPLPSRPQFKAPPPDASADATPPNGGATNGA